MSQSPCAIVTAAGTAAAFTPAIMVGPSRLVSSMSNSQPGGIRLSRRRERSLECSQSPGATIATPGGSDSTSAPLRMPAKLLKFISWRESSELSKWQLVHASEPSNQVLSEVKSGCTSSANVAVCAAPAASAHSKLPSSAPESTQAPISSTAVISAPSTLKVGPSRLVSSMSNSQPGGIRLSRRRERSLEFSQSPGTTMGTPGGSDKASAPRRMPSKLLKSIS